MMKWKRDGVEYLARTLIEQQQRTIVWRAYKIEPRSWALGISIRGTSMHIVVGYARTFRLVKTMALKAAVELGHREAP